MHCALLLTLSIVPRSARPRKAADIWLLPARNISATSMLAAADRAPGHSPAYTYAASTS